MSITDRVRASIETATAVQQRFSKVRGGNLAAAISMRAFLALFPIALLTLAAVASAGGDATRIGRDIADALGLGREFGRTLAESIRTAEDQQVLSSLVGIAGLVWTGTGLSAAMSAAWDSAWSTPGGALRGRALGVIWLLGGLLFLGATVGTTVLLQRADVFIQLGAIGGVVASSLFLFWTALLLPVRTIPWRAMVRPAIVGGVGLEAIRAIGATAVPALVRRSSSAYGAIGATFALLVWLLFMGRVIVYVASYERYRWDRRVTG